MKTLFKYLPVALLSLLVGVGVGYYVGKMTGELDGHLAASGGLRILEHVHEQQRGEKTAAVIQRLLNEEAEILWDLSGTVLGQTLIRYHFDDKSEADMDQFVKKHRS